MNICHQVKTLIQKAMTLRMSHILVKQHFKNRRRDVKTLPGADIDSDHNLLVAEVQTRLKEINNDGKRKPKWNLERIKSKENHMKEVMEQKFGQIDGTTRNVEDNWGERNSVGYLK